MSLKARRAEIAEFRAAFEAEVRRIVPMPEERLAVLYENYNGGDSFFDVVLTGLAEPGDPFDPGDWIAPVLYNVLPRWRSERLSARAGRMEAAAKTTAAKKAITARRNSETRSLALRLAATSKSTGPVSAARVRHWLQTHPDDRARVLGPEASPAEVPSVRTISEALRK